MNVKKFNKEKDYDKVIEFLNNQYKKNKNMVCWLPERFDDLIYRIDTLYHDERGLEKSSDYIYLFLDKEDIVGIIVPDGDSFNSSIKEGYEYIFSSMVDLAEEKLLPLFEEDVDGSINFLVVSHDSLKYQTEELIKRGYTKDAAGDSDNVAYPMETNYKINLPENFELVYGEDVPDIVKMRTCEYGFHPDIDDDNLYKSDPGLSYNARKNSQYYKDSFETLVRTKDGDYCSYCFCYVDKDKKTAFIEPVSTRLKYRKMGLCKEMLHGVINRCKSMGIEKCFINSYDWRVKVYNKCGFETVDTIGFWHKKIFKKRNKVK